jgi:CHAD domain-containing protein
MNTAFREFTFPDELDPDTLGHGLESVGTLHEESPKTYLRDYYDTFDWRVYGAGAAVEICPSGGRGWRTLTLTALSSGEVLAAVPLETSPRFADDLPPGKARERIESMIEMRALMPMARLRTHAKSFRVLNQDQKTVLRLVIERNALETDGAEQPPVIGTLLRVLPVKGYNKALRTALAQIDRLGLRPASFSLPLRAFEGAGLRPGSYSSKLNVHLDPNMRSDQAARKIFLHLLNAMEVNEEGTRKDLDSEFLHDFRVAVRRTRSALSQIKDVLPSDLVERYKADFAWLGQITGPTRDMDVYLLTFDTYRDALPQSLRDDLAPLHQFLEAHQSSEQTALSRALKGKRYRDMKQAWMDLLEHEAVAKGEPPPNAARAIVSVASERIWRMYRRVMKEGRAINDDSPAEELHELRKSCKKLRYLLEFFQSLYDAGSIKALIRALKELQENLGDFQDFEVQASSLRHFSEQMMEEGSVPAPTLMAMGVLAEGLITRQQCAREEFAERFAGFSADDVKSSFRELFASAPDTRVVE